MPNEIQSAIKSGHGTAIVYATMLGLFMSDILPTPADGIYFKVMRKNKEKLINREITPKQYWVRDATLYYTLNPIYWALLFGAVVAVKGDYNTKVRVGLSIVAAGAVIGILHSNIKKDEELQRLQDEQNKIV